LACTRAWGGAAEAVRCSPAPILGWGTRQKMHLQGGPGRPHRPRRPPQQRVRPRPPGSGQCEGALRTAPAKFGLRRAIFGGGRLLGVGQPFGLSKGPSPSTHQGRPQIQGAHWLFRRRERLMHLAYAAPAEFGPRRGSFGRGRPLGAGQPWWPGEAPHPAAPRGRPPHQRAHWPSRRRDRLTGLAYAAPAEFGGPRGSIGCGRLPGAGPPGGVRQAAPPKARRGRPRKKDARWPRRRRQRLVHDTHALAARFEGPRAGKGGGRPRAGVPGHGANKKATPASGADEGGHGTRARARARGRGANKKARPAPRAVGGGGRGGRVAGRGVGARGRGAGKSAPPRSPTLRLASHPPAPPRPRQNVRGAGRALYRKAGQIKRAAARPPTPRRPSRGLGVGGGRRPSSAWIHITAPSLP